MGAADKDADSRRGCKVCPYQHCVPIGGQNDGGVNPGVIAGPIIGAFLVVVSVLLFWWLRRKKVRDGRQRKSLSPWSSVSRRNSNILSAAADARHTELTMPQKRDLARLEDLAERARKGESSAFHIATGSTGPSSPVTSTRRQSAPMSQTSGAGAAIAAAAGVGGAATKDGRDASRQAGPLPNVPADAEYYDANGTTIRVYAGKRGVINADPNHPDNGGSGDPFADSRSMSTNGGESSHSTNVIPIHYVPAGQMDGSLAQVLASHRGASNEGVDPAAQQAAAARTLDLARQNLWRPRPGQGIVPPPRPARSPDLDLRLNPVRQPLGAIADANSSATSVNSRDSVHSNLSAAPSYMSGQTADLHLDAPKIITRQQVHVGRLQAAEVVHFGAGGVRPIPENDDDGNTDESAPDPFTTQAELLDPSSAANTSPGAGSATTFGTGAIHGGGRAAGSTTSLGSRRFDDDGNATAQPSPTDLRFSMGSLAYDRASVSTHGSGKHNHFLSPADQPPVPSIPSEYDRTRFQSISSFKSTGSDSLLGSFPIVPPAPGQTTRIPSTGLPFNSSTATIEQTSDHQPHRTASHPPVAGSNRRPVTATSSHSVADSFLGRFPFVPPGESPEASAAAPASAEGGQSDGDPRNPGRLTLGMSNVSGLGDFVFNFDGQAPPEIPPLPSPKTTPPPPPPSQVTDDQSTLRANSSRASSSYKSCE